MPRGEGTKKISDLFTKYQHTLKAPQGHVIAVFSEVVMDVLGIAIDESKISYTPHTKTLSVQTASPIKSEILLHKTELLTHLKGRLGERSAPTNIL